MLRSDILDILISPFGYLMNLCYNLIGDYGLAIIIFTIFTKIILLPVSVWVHKNSIKLIKMQPEINRIKVKFYGDGEKIAEEQSFVFKREKYNPLADLIPLFIQIALLLAVIEVIYNPLTYLLNVSQEDISHILNLTTQITGVGLEVSSIQVTAVNTIKNPEFTQMFLSIQEIPNIEDIISAVQGINTNFLIFDLSIIPVSVWGISTLVPILAGLSSYLLSFVQNKINVLQSEQSNFTKISTLLFSVGLSLYLGLFVPAGVALYWVIGNIYAILQLFVLNSIIKPKDYINYEELLASRKELEEINNLGGKKKKWYQNDENSKREKADYKRFFSIANKKLVFYSERSGFYKYFENVIEELLRMSNISIHYITSDPNDQIFEIAKKENRIKPYYIGERKLITLMMKMDADVVVMTMSDLGNFHIKKSIVKKDVEYVYMFHYPLSTHMVLRNNALDNYDTIFCVGEFQFDEIRKWEEINELNPKTLIPVGYGVLEKMEEAYLEKSEIRNEMDRPIVLIAPSWQEDNILDSCIDELLKYLLETDYKIVVRPHPEYVKRYKTKMDKLVSVYSGYSEDKLYFELDFSDSSTIFSSDVLISDWSGAAYEFSFVTKKPALFINTKMKVHNTDYEKVGIVPLEISLRDKIGKSLDKDEISNIRAVVEQLLSEKAEYEQTISTILDNTISNYGESGKVGAKELLKILTRAK